MVDITIVDNGGETFDRYVVTIGRDVYTMSMHPQQLNGFNQYAGDIEGYGVIEGGNEITVNEEILKAILERI
jgi:hypothetical protein